MDFLNKSQKVYVDEEQKKTFMEKLKRDVEVAEPFDLVFLIVFVAFSVKVKSINWLCIFYVYLMAFYSTHYGYSDTWGDSLDTVKNY